MSGLGSIGAIAAGNISGAAGLIERTMAASIPLALDFVGRLVGIGNLGQKIKRVIQKVRGRLDKLVDKLVLKVKGLIGKIKTGATNTADKAKKFISGTFGKQSFRAKKENHSVWVDLKNNDPTFMIASTPAEGRAQLAVFLNDARKVGKADLVAPHVAQGKRIIASGLTRIKTKAPTLTDKQASLIQMIGSFTKPLANTVETIRTIVQDEDAGYKFVDDGGVKRMQPVTINFKYNKNDRVEMDRQVAGQQTGLNNIRLDKWTQNRNTYLVIGRDKAGAVAQAGERSDHAEKLFNLYLANETKNNKTQSPQNRRSDLELISAARKLADAEMSTLAALHDPDQIAGGEGDKISGIGMGGINSSIGSQWKNNVHILDQAVGKIPSSARSEGHMNVRISLT